MVMSFFLYSDNKILFFVRLYTIDFLFSFFSFEIIAFFCEI